jgi:molybdopterin synthase catalytic subunit
MKVRLLAFASVREALGAAELELDLPEGGDVETLRRLLVERHPELAPLWPRLAIAVDGELVRGNPTLTAGQEVALLPPVSGGTENRVALVDGPLVVDDLIACVRSDSRGAVIIFLGNVRDHHRGRAVERLTYQAYRSMALAALERIVDELSDPASSLELAIHHRLGEVPAGETSVAIVAASPHREAAYAASRTALERLKREVPIWKREHYQDGGEAWREEELLEAAKPAG